MTIIRRSAARAYLHLATAALVALSSLVSPSVAHAVDDYPYPAASPGAVDPWGFYYRYCTSFVAWRMNRNAGPMSFYNYMDGGHWGNAGNWGRNARALGYPVNTTPAVGAIAWWAAGTISYLGHVAYVEAVNGDGTVVVEEYNYEYLRYTRRTIPGGSVSGYIHFHDVPPPPPPPPPPPDVTAPVISLSCVKDGAVYASGITPAFSAADAALKSVAATLDGAAFTSGALVSAAGAHTLVVTAIDAAGNKAVTAAVFAIDPTAIDPDVAFVTIAGADRYGTAVRTSQISFDRSESVIIATGENWPDALGGIALAGALEAPVLLTPGAALPSAVMAEIRRLGAASAVVLGGPGAVGAGVEAALKSELGEDAVRRIGGADRYETAESIAREVVAAQGAAYDGTCLTVTGTAFPDALAASALSAAKRWPLVLVATDGRSGSVTATVDALSATNAVILGGDAAVPESVEASLVAHLGADAVRRLGGTDRYATAAEVAQYAAAQGLQWDKAALATGQDFPDALAGGAAQGHLGSIMLLTRSTAFPPEAKACLVDNRGGISTIRFLGRESAVCTAVKLAVSQALE